MGVARKYMLTCDKLPEGVENIPKKFTAEPWQSQEG